MLGQNEGSGPDEQALADNLQAKLSIGDSQIEGIDRALEASRLRIRHQLSEKSKNKKSLSSYFSWQVLVPVSAMIIAGVLVGPKILQKPALKLYTDSGDITLSNDGPGSYSYQQGDLKETTIGKQVTFKYSQVNNLKAEKKGGVIKLAMQECDCFFAFKKGAIKNLSIKTPLGKYEVLGTSFKLNVSKSGETLLVKTGTVKAVFEGKDYIVHKGHGFSTGLRQVYSTEKIKAKGKATKPAAKRANKPVSVKTLTRGLIAGSSIMVILKDKSRLPAVLKNETASSIVVEINGRNVTFAKARVDKVVKK